MLKIRALVSQHKIHGDWSDFIKVSTDEGGSKIYFFNTSLFSLFGNEIDFLVKGIKHMLFDNPNFIRYINESLKKLRTFNV